MYLAPIFVLDCSTANYAWQLYLAESLGISNGRRKIHSEPLRKIDPELPQYVDTQLHMEQNDGDAFSGSHFATLVN
jgi:hypothetical protein